MFTKDKSDCNTLGIHQYRIQYFGMFQHKNRFQIRKKKTNITLQSIGIWILRV